MHSIYVLTQSHRQHGATPAEEKEKIKQAVPGARVHLKAACLSPLNSSASHRNRKLCHGRRRGFSRRGEEMFLRRAELSESWLPGATFLFFLQREWEMDGTAAPPSHTSAHILDVWAADELFCCEG